MQHLNGTNNTSSDETSVADFTMSLSEVQDCKVASDTSTKADVITDTIESSPALNGSETCLASDDTPEDTNMQSKKGYCSIM